VFPVQDVLSLGSEARMNMPSRAAGNWIWRLRENEFTAKHVDRLAELVETYGREGKSVE